jgi:hypothetical protein
MSAMATSLVFASALSALAAAPFPRPPHPISPIRRRSARLPWPRADAVITIPADAVHASRMNFLREALIRESSGEIYRRAL